MRTIISALSILLFTGSVVSAQTNPRSHTPNANGHSHNDYLRKRPFHEAYENHFGSIELDVFLVDGRLCVAHTRAGIRRSRTVGTLYLEPLLERIRLNGGKAYPDGGKLQLLIELKTGSDETLRALERLLQPVRHYFDTEHDPEAVRIVISGNIPSPSRFSEYDPIFFFDGRAGSRYTNGQLDRVAQISAPLRRFTKWRGRGVLPEADRLRIESFVSRIHGMGKKVRFWGCPDTKKSWQTFIDLGVDYINTDDPSGLARFMNEN